MAAKRKSKPANMTLGRLTKSVLLRRVARLEKQLDAKTRTIFELTTAAMEDDQIHAESMAALVEARNTWTKKAVELEEKLLAQQGFIDGLTGEIVGLVDVDALEREEHTCEIAARLLREQRERILKLEADALDDAMERLRLTAPIVSTRKRHLTSEYGS